MAKLQVVFSDKEEFQVKELAKKENRSVSGYIRKIILDKIRGEEDG